MKYVPGTSRHQPLFWCLGVCYPFRVQPWVQDTVFLLGAVRERGFWIDLISSGVEWVCSNIQQRVSAAEQQGDNGHYVNGWYIEHIVDRYNDIYL